MEKIRESVVALCQVRRDVCVIFFPAIFYCGIFGTLVHLDANVKLCLTGIKLIAVLSNPVTAVDLFILLAHTVCLEVF